MSEHNYPFVVWRGGECRIVATNADEIRVEIQATDLLGNDVWFIEESDYEAMNAFMQCIIDCIERGLLPLKDPETEGGPK